MLTALEKNLLSRAAVGDMLTRSAAKFGSRTAIVSGDLRISFQALNQKSCRAANAFRKMGIQKGDRVAFMTHNCLGYIFCCFGLVKIGAIPTPVNFMLQGEEISFIINNAGPKAFFVEDSLLEKVMDVRSDLPDELTLGWIDFGKAARPEDCMDVEQLYSSDYPADEPEVVIDPGDQCMMMYTSGTESLPKGVMSTHLNYYMSSLHVAVDLRFQREDVMMIDIPLFHVGGMTPLIGAITAGSRVILEYAPDPVKTLNYIQDEKITLLIYPPTMFMALLSVPGFRNYQLDSLRKHISFGAVLPQVIMERWNEVKPGLKWQNFYGSTETTAPGATSHPGDFAEKGNAIGLPATGLTLRIADHNGSEQPVGEPGEIIIRGPAVMAGYWGTEEKTAETFRNGWHHTGDIAYRDQDGYLYFVDRKKDMIKTGGENVSSQEVEGILLRHPRINQAAVIGVPDDYWMEAVIAFVVPNPGETLSEDDVIAFCKENMAGYKVPKKVIVKSRLPMTPSGKILKRRIRDDFIGT